jgi:glycosyltransferase involved in cell wall biosynthesis
MKSFARFACLASLKAANVKADVVFASSTPLTIAIPGIYTARRQGIPLVFEVRDLWPEMPIAVGALRNRFAIALAGLLEKVAYRSSARIVALSPGIKTGVVKVGHPAERVAVIPNGCDFELFEGASSAGMTVRKKYAWLGDRPLILYAGQIGRVNWVEYLAGLAEAVGKRNSKVALVVVGEGGEKEKLRKIAEDSGTLNRNLYLMEAVSKEEIPAWYSAADIVLSVFVNMQQMWANSANKFFDALAAGRPVAINYGGWQSELIQKGKFGLLLDPENLQSAARKLCDGLADREGLARMGGIARDMGTEMFSRDKLARQLEAVLVDAFTEGK